MIRITNNISGKHATVDAKEFYYNSLQPMIIDKCVYGDRHWDDASLLFFNVPASNSELSKSQLRDTFRYLHLEYNLFIDMVKKNEHPFIMLVDKPYKYNRPNQLYLFEQDNGIEICMGEHLSPITITFIN